MTQVSVNNPCLPPPEPCRSPITPLFSAGVSIRQVPLCVDPTCECPQLAYGRAMVSTAGSLDRSEWLKGWIIAQLTTRGEVSCDEHPLRVRAGGWWADSFRSPATFRSGSKLWALQWSFVTNGSLIAAKQYAAQALLPLLQWGIAARTSVSATYVSRKVMALAIDVSGPGSAAAVAVQGTAMPDAGWLWQEYVNQPAEIRARIGPQPRFTGH